MEQKFEIYFTGLECIQEEKKGLFNPAEGATSEPMVGIIVSNFHKEFTISLDRKFTKVNTGDVILAYNPRIPKQIPFAEIPISELDNDDPVLKITAVIVESDAGDEGIRVFREGLAEAAKKGLESITGGKYFTGFATGIIKSLIKAEDDFVGEETTFFTKDELFSLVSNPSKFIQSVPANTSVRIRNDKWGKYNVYFEIKLSDYFDEKNNLRGKAIDVATGYDGSVYVVGISKRVFKWNTTINNWDTFTDTPDNVKRIAIDANTHQPWIILDDNSILQFVNGSWMNKPGRAIDIAASPSGVYCIGISKRLFKWDDDADDWNLIDENMREGKRVSVSPHGIPWVVTENNNIKTFINNSWRNVYGGALDISVGPNDKVWVVGVSKRLFEFEDGRWELRDNFNKASDLSIDKNGNPVFLDEDNLIYYWKI